VAQWPQNNQTAMLSGKPVPGTKFSPANNGWNSAIFLFLLGASEADKGIQTDNLTGCQLIWVTSASGSIHPPPFLCQIPFVLLVPSQFILL